MANLIFPVRVDSKLGYFSYYAVPANDKKKAAKIAREQFEIDFGCSFNNSTTYVWDARQNISGEFKQIQ